MFAGISPPPPPPPFEEPILSVPGLRQNNTEPVWARIQVTDLILYVWPDIFNNKVRPLGHNPVPNLLTATDSPDSNAVY